MKIQEMMSRQKLFVLIMSINRRPGNSGYLPISGQLYLSAYHSSNIGLASTPLTVVSIALKFRQDCANTLTSATVGLRSHRLYDGW